MRAPLSIYIGVLSLLLSHTLAIKTFVPVSFCLSLYLSLSRGPLLLFCLINTDAQSAGPPKLDQPQHNHSTANSRSRRSRNHARGSLGSLGLASLFACCFVPFSLRWFGIRVATLPASLGWASRRPKLCITQLGLAARSSALLVAAARIVRRRVVGLHCAHMLTTPIGPRIVRCSVSLGRAARSPATRRYS
jgi:hypothetical protein